jgi:Protoglobin
MAAKMQHISALSLEDLPSRIAYLSSFLELTAEDGEALLAAKPLVAPLVPAILDAVYTKLLHFDITAQAFVPRNTGYEGETVKSVQELTIEHPQIAMRKDFLKVRTSSSSGWFIIQKERRQSDTC